MARERRKPPRTCRPCHIDAYVIDVAEGLGFRNAENQAEPLGRINLCSGLE